MAASNRVRIGGGEWRSRLLDFPDVPGLRPTPDRVRQTLFNWLGQDLHGLNCLDLFSGTGVMGFEALSRGAAQAVMVEKSLPAVKSLQANKTLLQADKARILQQDALQFLAQNRELFNIIFVDPPYQQGWLPKLLPALATHLANQGYVYVEAEYVLESDGVWQVHKHGKAGNVFYHLLKLADESAN
ncbi:16S rRNA (guanine(966)-N(2))-methyltransferase RsmD [Methylobacillus gramineus]|uniref:16S rRNA (guanine(966)-N(2))-methyltransferase RsmD n=1 Tax=Methylobacillus gramineus TaxID=755169 RepID=UPI001CFF9908|nr:16S rRNA (guanine(966)-N(2))-methyltransferase RsmD [Methylobacillus gramineus]MCB5184930.1 16S rRNA (guanine(966)-N(2))-methyltransferase RsmD [Methylobacillus gramineus]